MADNAHRSPAARSFEEEQIRQAKKEQRGALDKVLDDTFPASDPPAMTAPGIATGGADVEAAGALNAATKPSDRSASDQPAPLVDEALAANHLWQEQQEINDLRAEVSRLQKAVLDGVPRVGRLAVEEVAAMLRDRPLAVAATVGAFAFVLGATR